jgi:hypothetical protein
MPKKLLTVDIEGAEEKNETLNNTHKAVEFLFTKFGAETLKQLRLGIRGKFLNVRSGHLWRNLDSIIRKRKNKVSAETGTGVGTKREVKYARILDEGGTIKAINAKFLTIPFKGVKGEARDFDDTFFLRSKAGNLLLVQKTTTGFRPLFTLKESVEIPAKEWFSKPMKKQENKFKKEMTSENIIRVAEKLAGF